MSRRFVGLFVLPAYLAATSGFLLALHIEAAHSAADTQAAHCDASHHDERDSNQPAKSSDDHQTCGLCDSLMTLSKGATDVSPAVALFALTDSDYQSPDQQIVVLHAIHLPYIPRGPPLV